MTSLKAKQAPIYKRYPPEFPSKLFLLCSLLLTLAAPVIGVEKHSESLATALSMLEDRELHTQSALRFSNVYSYVAGIDATDLKDILRAIQRNLEQVSRIVFVTNCRSPSSKDLRTVIQSKHLSLWRTETTTIAICICRQYSKLGRILT